MVDVAIMSYRDWAWRVVSAIQRHPKVSSIDVFQSDIAFKLEMQKREEKGEKLPDIVAYIGWSSEPLEEWVKRIPHIGVHCAESDIYSGGTPLQNQINDGLTTTKHRIFKVWYPELSLRQWSHEVDLDLSGNMDDVLAQMVATSRVLFNRFFDDYPNITWKTWPAVKPEEMRPPRRPENSALSKDDVQRMTTKELYNFFRGLEEPYPNGYIEDEHGRLIIEHVAFKEKS